MKLKALIRQFLMALHIDATKNLKYDRLTSQVMRNHLDVHSSGVDVGAHKGEILDELLKFAPKGSHIAFEPIPSLYETLITKYGKKVKLFPYALSDKKGKSTFQVVQNDLAYSGLKKRRYDRNDPVIEEITVEVKTLDGLLPAQKAVDFLKIDVEGGELDVLKGSRAMLKREHPLILFEFGVGSTEFYDSKPEDLYNLLQDCGYSLYTLPAFAAGGSSLLFSDFIEVYRTTSDYYFVAHFETKEN